MASDSASDSPASDEPVHPHKKSRIETADEILAELAKSAVAALSQQSVVTEEMEDEPPQSPITFLKRAGLSGRPMKRRQTVPITPPRLPEFSPCKQPYPRGDVTPATASAARCLLELHR